ncbi:hypothetical protein QBC37DRAFT_389931 [Rhypophila decipiens]|uniref:Uncharacterized protein n=1 Tax=Rhypophila decipiens TaxID=261697 RepID=A0AAN6Y201_9PEZI|nr:hypothetical protein QBC37DRAFT_389931 [Rhypophila decipiens]
MEDAEENRGPQPLGSPGPQQSTTSNMTLIPGQNHVTSTENPPFLANDGDQFQADDCVHGVEPTNNTNRTHMPVSETPLEDDLDNRGPSLGLPGEDILPQVLISGIDGQPPNSTQPLFESFNPELFLSIRNNQTLCFQGFAANEDLYGLGIRAGIYLQWVTALLVNNLLPDGQREAQRVYLVFSVSLCLTTYVMSFFRGSCVFGIEIEVLYWLYWGGVVCVFASSPSQTRLGAKKAKWIGLDWKMAIQYTTHIMMFYHGIWFIWWAYDQVFARMPCGTYQFFVAPLLDPSPTYDFVRDFLTQLISAVALPLLFAIPYITYLLAAEIKNSIRDSTICQQFLPNWSKSATGTSPEPEAEPQTTGMETRVTKLLSLFIRGLGNWHLWNKKVYRWFRRKMDLPVRARGGIRLITPIDVANRRAYRIRCIILGVTSCAMSITAIECLLSWNKVVSIYNIRSTGQYIALTMGLAGFFQACWQLVNQEEARRRRDLTRRQLIGQDIELDQFPLSMSGALRAAFSRPDIGFLTNDGALPPPVTAAVSRTSTSSSLSENSSSSTRGF